MKKYVVTFTRITARSNQCVRFLAKVVDGYPYKANDLNEAAVFNTKAAARTEICKINRNNLYNLEINYVLLNTL